MKKKLTILSCILTLQFTTSTAENFYQKCGIDFVLNGNSRAEVAKALERTTAFVRPDEEIRAQMALLKGMKCVLKEDPSNHDLSGEISWVKTMIGKVETEERSMSSNSGGIKPDQSPAEAVAIIKSLPETTLSRCFLNHFANGNTIKNKEVLLPSADVFDASVKKAFRNKTGVYDFFRDIFYDNSDKRLVQCFKEVNDGYQIEEMRRILSKAMNNHAKTLNLMQK